MPSLLQQPLYSRSLLSALYRLWALCSPAVNIHAWSHREQLRSAEGLSPPCPPAHVPGLVGQCHLGHRAAPGAASCNMSCMRRCFLSSLIFGVDGGCCVAMEMAMWAGRAIWVSPICTLHVLLAPCVPVAASPIVWGFGHDGGGLFVGSHQTKGLGAVADSLWGLSPRPGQVPGGSVGSCG